MLLLALMGLILVLQLRSHILERKWTRAHQLRHDAIEARLDMLSRRADLLSEFAAVANDAVRVARTSVERVDASKPGDRLVVTDLVRRQGED